MAANHRTVPIRGVPVTFPLGKKPFAPQLAMMSQMIAALSTGRNALLEAPTGTGKTLALLCSVISWQKYDCEESSRLLHSSVKRNTSNSREVVSASIAPAAASNSANRSSERGRAKVKKRRVFFMSRTHSQLTQVVREMKNFGALSAEMTIIGSREQYCINTALDESKSKSEDCKHLLASTGCQYYSSNASLKNALPPRVWDIEDLVQTGRKKRKCPYFASRVMVSESDLIFGPYNYIIDPVIRKDMDIKLENAVLLFDEGHNVLDAAREGLSMMLGLQQLRDIVKELKTCAGGQNEPLAHTVLHSSMNGLLLWFEQRVNAGEIYRGCEDEKNILEGVQFVGALGASVNFTGESMVHIQTNLDVCTAFSKEVGMAEMRSQHHAATPEDMEILGAPHLTGASLSALRRLITICDNVLRDSAQACCHFKAAIVRSFSERSARDPTRDFFAPRGTAFRGVYSYSLQIWCLSASVAFRDICNEAHSVIITSGTLSPLSSFASELGQGFPIRLEARHVIDKVRQLWVGTLGQGPRSVSLTATFQNSGKFSYQDGLGQTILAHLPSIPGGVLCFFPSYSLLDKCIKRWRTTKLLAKMRAIKTVVIEPRKAGQDFDKCMKRFRSAIDFTANRAEKRIAKLDKLSNATAKRGGRGDHEKQGGKKEQKNSVEIGKGGALFFAVCRGKLSEGIDFADRHARAVFIVGIPYPNSRSVEVILKKKHCNAMRCLDNKFLTGNGWYAQQAFRALNQAVGRCIRHRDDYGAILLLDSRFTFCGKGGGAISNLSKWLRDNVRYCNHYHESATELKSFFQRNIRFSAQIREQRKKEKLADVHELQSRQKRTNQSLDICKVKADTERECPNRVLVNTTAVGEDDQQSSKKSWMRAFSEDDDFADGQLVHGSKMRRQNKNNKKLRNCANYKRSINHRTKESAGKVRRANKAENRIDVNITQSMHDQIEQWQVDKEYCLSSARAIPRMNLIFPKWREEINTIFDTQRNDWEALDRRLCSIQIKRDRIEDLQASAEDANLTKNSEHDLKCVNFFVNHLTRLRDQARALRYGNYADQAELQQRHTSKHNSKLRIGPSNTTDSSRDDCTRQCKNKSKQRTNVGEQITKQFNHVSVDLSRGTKSKYFSRATEKQQDKCDNICISDQTMLKNTKKNHIIIEYDYSKQKAPRRSMKEAVSAGRSANDTMITRHQNFGRKSKLEEGKEGAMSNKQRKKSPMLKKVTQSKFKAKTNALWDSTSDSDDFE